jgi:hypothetical protein
MRTLLLLSLTIGFGCAAVAPDEVEESEVVAAVIAACPPGQWCVESAADAEAPLLHSVFAINAGDVFAVGDNGTILRRTNSEWRAMSSGTTVNLRGVWAASSTDVWAVGVGTILHFDGTVWSTVPAPDSLPLDAVWGSGRGDVWMVGSSRVLRWNGAGFTTFDLGGTLVAVHGTGPNDVWATGEQANLRRFNGVSWSTVTSSVGPNYFAVHALSTTDVWTTPLVLGKETARLTSGTKWMVKTTGGFIFQSLSSLAANDIWAAGGNDRVGHWNGLSWTTDQPFGTGASLWSITTTPGHAWVVGTGSLIAHRSL